MFRRDAMPRSHNPAPQEGGWPTLSRSFCSEMWPFQAHLGGYFPALKAMPSGSPYFPSSILSFLSKSSVVYLRIFKVAVVGPDWNLELERKGQDVHIVGVTASDTAFGFGEAVGVGCTINDRDRQAGDSEKQEICGQALLFSEYGCVLFHFRERRLGGKYFFGFRASKDQPGTTTQHSRQQDVSVRGEFHDGLSAIPQSLPALLSPRSPDA